MNPQQEKWALTQSTQGWKSIFQINVNKQANVDIHLCNKIDFQNNYSKEVEKGISYSSKEKYTDMTPQF